MGGCLDLWIWRGFNYDTLKLESCSPTLGKEVVEELYKNGTSELTMNDDSLRNNTSSIIADLKILNGKENKLLKLFKNLL